MSGHSHWSSIKHKKGAEDQKRGKIFSKMARVLSIAAKERGGDPTANSKLRMAIEQAKAVNMPKDKIERAIQKGIGGLGGEKLEEFLFEAYGPGKTAIIIEGITDNKNRTLGEIKQILSQHNGKLASEGSVQWLFERKGTITINNEQKTIDKEGLELTAIEAGAEDIYWHAATPAAAGVASLAPSGRDLLDVYTKPEDLEKVKKILEEKGLSVESVSLDWVAKEQIEVEEKEKASLEKLFEALDENDAIQDIYSNLKT